MKDSFFLLHKANENFSNFIKLCAKNLLFCKTKDKKLFFKEKLWYKQKLFCQPQAGFKYCTWSKATNQKCKSVLSKCQCFA